MSGVGIFNAGVPLSISSGTGVTELATFAWGTNSLRLPKNGWLRVDFPFKLNGEALKMYVSDANGVIKHYVLYAGGMLTITRDHGDLQIESSSAKQEATRTKIDLVRGFCLLHGIAPEVKALREVIVITPGLPQDLAQKLGLMVPGLKAASVATYGLEQATGEITNDVTFVIIIPEVGDGPSG